MRVVSLCAILLPVVSAGQFSEHTITNDLKGGYQVVAADLNHDGKPDLIVVASGQTDLVWYENPGWQRHVIAQNVRAMINLAYWNDQIVLASEFANEAKKSIGIISLLTPNGDPRELWTVREIDRLTTSHRLRWADVEGNSKKVLVNAPLTGSDSEPPMYRGQAPLVFYRPGEWKRQSISSANEGVQHGIFIVDWDGDSRDAILTASFSGIHLYKLNRQNQWTRTQIAQGDPEACPRCGSSDVTVGKFGKERFLAAIEPWHGNEVAVYRYGHGSWNRAVIDDTLSQGHTIVTADLNGDGRDEIVAGYRGNGGAVLIYQADSKGVWSKSTLDNQIAANACVVADLDSDGGPDLACVGGTALKWYENRAAR